MAFVNTTETAVVEIGPDKFRRAFLTIPLKFLSDNYFMILRNHKSIKPVHDHDFHLLEPPTETIQRSISNCKFFFFFLI